MLNWESRLNIESYVGTNFLAKFVVAQESADLSLLRVANVGR